MVPRLAVRTGPRAAPGVRGVSPASGGPHRGEPHDAAVRAAPARRRRRLPAHHDGAHVRPGRAHQRRDHRAEESDRARRPEPDLVGAPRQVAGPAGDLPRGGGRGPEGDHAGSPVAGGAHRTGRAVPRPEEGRRGRPGAGGGDPARPARSRALRDAGPVLLRAQGRRARPHRARAPRPGPAPARPRVPVPRAARRRPGGVGRGDPAPSAGRSSWTPISTAHGRRWPASTSSRRRRTRRSSSCARRSSCEPGQSRPARPSR